jgi:hypothetical protein
MKFAIVRLLQGGEANLCLSLTLPHTCRNRKFFIGIKISIKFLIVDQIILK